MLKIEQFQCLCTAHRTFNIKRNNAILKSICKNFLTPIQTCRHMYTKAVCERYSMNYLSIWSLICFSNIIKHHYMHACMLWYIYDEHLKNQMQLHTLTNAHAKNSNPITFVTLLCEFIAIAYHCINFWVNLMFNYDPSYGSP